MGIDRRTLIGSGAASLGLVFARPALAAARKAAPPAAPAPDPTHPIVETTAGKVRGYQTGAVRIFRGVRYGASTEGRRFRPPLAAEPWTGVQDAASFGARSPQLELKTMAETAAAETHEPMSEDCLFLNVWTPAADDAGKRPVMVWLHGGGFANGSGANVRYDGSNLAEREDVVVVTVNHRLNAFGYLHLGDLLGDRYATSGNVGVEDLVLALQWVKANIASFGGDPGRVTVFGESGGGRKVSVLMAMPAAQGLFHRAIVESGATLRMSTREEGTRAAEKVLAELGLTRTDALKLTTLPTAALLNAMDQSGQGDVRPVVDGQALPSHPFDPGAPMISAEVPMIIGSNATETTFRPDTPLDPIGEIELRRRVQQFTGAHPTETLKLIATYRKSRPKCSQVELYQLISSDYWMGADTTAQAERKAALGRAPAYLYHFEKTTPVRGGRLRSPHMLEVPYVFDNLDKSVELAGASPSDAPLAQVMSRAWAAFARTGDPNAEGLPQWLPYGPDRPVMVFDDQSRVLMDPRRSERLAVAALKARQA